MDDTEKFDIRESLELLINIQRLASECAEIHFSVTKQHVLSCNCKDVDIYRGYMRDIKEITDEIVSEFEKKGNNNG